MTDTPPETIKVKVSAAPGLWLSFARIVAVLSSMLLAQKFAAGAGGMGLALAHLGEIIAYATGAATWVWELWAQRRSHQEKVALAVSAPIGEVKL